MPRTLAPSAILAPSASAMLSAIVLSLATVPACAAEPTIALELRGQWIEATPLWASDRQVLLLGRDGRLWDVGADEPSQFRQTSQSFQGYTAGEMRGQLQREFGSRFEVSGTGHYLVVHPAGQRDAWAQRFEDLYRSFVHYFSVRGFRPSEPRFPLVAVVLHNQGEFLSLADKSGARVGPGVLGYYDLETNRVLLYDQTGGRATGDDWQFNAETIIHEAAHQTAFNTGVHNRFAAPPRWVTEGLGTLFEAPGVYDSRHYTRLEDRLNRSRLEAFRRHAAGKGGENWLGDLVATDRFFQSNGDRAYALAWAVTFFLSESEPRKYSQYLAATAAQADFQPPSDEDRVRQFTQIFGSDFAMLEARVMRFIATLP